ncbi:kinase-like domain-containing protein [Aspergillus bertholletiae]|uniref:Kinase-like domain-containing protein n=1 Tax=Aspergillus bertholletiae TaxID=1226010 RepID=A0A5N7B3F4_9EURO|nr:kinase-like domain-containing protein [Aspergillus bertholletiae]
MASEDKTFQPQVLYRNGDRVVTRINADTVTKEGKDFTIYEAMALLLLNDLDNEFPVPKVHSIQYEDGRKIDIEYKNGKTANIVFLHDSLVIPSFDESGRQNTKSFENHGIVKITMDFAEGETLDKLWSSFDEEKKKVLAADLKRCVSMFREITGSTKIGARFEGPVRIKGGSGILEGGPFNSVEEFNAFLEEHGETPERNASQKIVFTHGDLVPQNILVNSENKVTTLVDWELAGHYPEYWEYRSAKCDPLPGWKEFLKSIFPDKDEQGNTS